MTILAYFSALGFDIALLRFVPAYQTTEAWSLARGVIQYAERRVLAVSVLVMLTGASVIMIWSREFSPELRNTFLVGFILAPVWALLWIRCAIVRAFGGVVLALVPDRVARDGLLLVLVVLASLALRRHTDGPLVMMATLVGSIVALGLASLAMRRLRPDMLTAVLPEYAAATWRHTAVPLVIIAAAEALLDRTGVVLLGWFGETRDAGIYNLAFNIAFLVVFAAHGDQHPVRTHYLEPVHAERSSDAASSRDESGVMDAVCRALHRARASDPGGTHPHLVRQRLCGRRPCPAHPSRRPGDRGELRVAVIRPDDDRT